MIDWWGLGASPRPPPYARAGSFDGTLTEMAAPTSRIYFSIRANAHGLLAGAPVEAVRRRIVAGALLHDEVIIDDGLWDGRAGPSGSFELHIPSARSETPLEYQTARARGRSLGANFHVATKASESAGPPRTVLKSSTTIGWSATLEPMKREMPRAYPWLHFMSLDLLPEDKGLVSRMVAEDQRDRVLSDLIPDEFSRKLVMGSTNYALVLGGRLEAAVSMDAMHSRALSARVARGQANPVFGSGALQIMFPTIARLSWEELDDARKLRGLQALRGLLATLEAHAWQEAEQGRTLEDSIVQGYVAAMDAEVAKFAPSFKGAAGAVAIGALLSLVTGPLPLVAGLTIGAGQTVAGAARAHHRYERSWMAAANKLHKVAKPTRI